MTDEEKKAIKELKKRYIFFYNNPLATNVWLSLDIHNLGIILNLIEKQQKEIEELKENCKKCVVRDRLDEYVNEIYTKNEFISKVKIIDKIEDIKRERNSCFALEEFKSCKKCNENCNYDEYIKLLQELLESED